MTSLGGIVGAVTELLGVPGMLLSHDRFGRVLGAIR